MKLYYHPVSTTSRPIMLFAAVNEIVLDFKVVDLFTGEHLQPAYAVINPNRLVPVLEDGDFYAHFVAPFKDASFVGL